MIKIKLEGMASVIEGLRKEVEGINQRSVKGLVLCQGLLKREAMEITPWQTGHLAGSYQTPPPFEGTPGVFMAIVENTAHYAVHVHEKPENLNWNKDGTGPKFLEKPLFENADKFREILRDAASV